jgi:hypothetical protein
MVRPVTPDRAPDWEARLAGVLREASTRAFDAQEWNCARFAHRCAEAVSGRALPFRRVGSLEGSVDALFPRVPVKFAQRGDVVAADVPEPSLGICIGTKAAFLAESGLYTVAMRDVRVVWGV